MDALVKSEQRQFPEDQAKIDSLCWTFIRAGAKSKQELSEIMSEMGEEPPEVTLDNANHSRQAYPRTVSKSNRDWYDQIL